MNDALLTFEDEQFQGAAAIAQKLASLAFKTVRYQLVKCDCRPTMGDMGIIACVTGSVFIDDSQNPLLFAETFILLQDPAAQNEYRIINDVFRLVVA